MASVNAGDRQIRQMVEFIRLEAKEKTQEIRAKVGPLLSSYPRTRLSRACALAGQGRR
jgi:hypothetical protein